MTDLNIAGSLLEFFHDHARRHGDRPALVYPGSGEASDSKRVTYDDLYDNALRACTVLAELNLPAGSTVALLHHDAWQAFPLLAACAARKLSLVPLNPDLHPDESRHILQHADPALIVGDMEEVALPKGGGSASRMTLAAFTRELEVAEGSRPNAAESHRHPALVVYTSGTTGGSKAVALPEGSLLFAAASTARFYGLTAADRVYGVLPYHHMNAVMATGLIPMSAGATTLVAPSFGFTSAKFYWQSVAESGATICSLTPSIMSMLLKLDSRGTDAALDAVRFVWCGAAPLPEELWLRFEEAFKKPVYQGYGLTETSFWVTCVPPDEPRVYDAVGVPVDCEIRIDRGALPSGEGADGLAWGDAAGLEGEAGEVLIRSGGLMSGYFRDKRLTAAAMTDDGFFRTGDIGTLLEDGQLRIVGRKKEILIRNGINILPGEVDQVMGEHPSVRECKTIGRPDEIMGERIVTVFVPNDGVDPDDACTALRGYARERLSSHKRPDDLVALDYLPKTSTGKVALGSLRRIVSGEMTDLVGQALVKRRHRRADPVREDEVRELVDRSVRTGAPLRFVKYWGVGERAEFNDQDRQALTTLQRFLSGVQVIPELQTELTLVLNDMHGRMNGRVPERAKAYLESIGRAAREAGFRVEWESDLWGRGGLDLDRVVGEAGREETHSWFQGLDVRDKLVEQAGKHSNERGPEEGARLYATACRLANRVMEEQFAGHIFLTYNPPEMDLVSPDLPRLYIFPWRRGLSIKPWFSH